MCPPAACSPLTVVLDIWKGTTWDDYDGADTASTPPVNRNRNASVVISNLHETAKLELGVVFMLSWDQNKIIMS